MFRVEEVQPGNISKIKRMKNRIKTKLCKYGVCFFFFGLGSVKALLTQATPEQEQVLVVSLQIKEIRKTVKKRLHLWVSFNLVFIEEILDRLSR